MTSKDKILKEIRASKTDTKELLLSPLNGIEYPDKKAQFINVLNSIGGQIFDCDDLSEISDFVNQETAKGKRVIHVSNKAVIDIAQKEMYSLDILVVEGSFGVAENGAIWIKEQHMGNRVLPFSCQQLVVILPAQQLVNNMHEAYDYISINEDGYGVFIAGPSKTADIEQSLVIGAHGPVSFSVFLLN